MTEIDELPGNPVLEMAGATVDLATECTVAYVFGNTSDGWKFVECTALADPKAQQVVESEC